MVMVKLDREFKQDDISNHSQLWDSMVKTSLVPRHISRKYRLDWILFTLHVHSFYSKQQFPKKCGVYEFQDCYMKSGNELVILRKGSERLYSTFPNRGSFQHKNSTLRVVWKINLFEHCAKYSLCLSTTTTTTWPMASSPGCTKVDTFVCIIKGIECV